MPRYYTFPNGRPMLYQTQEIAFPIRIRYYAIRGWLPLEEFDRILMLLESNGLVAKWDRESTFKIIKIEGEPPSEPLNLAHLQGAFFVWAFGMLIAIVFLLFECFAGHFRCCKSKVSKTTRIVVEAKEQEQKNKSRRNGARLY